MDVLNTKYTIATSIGYTLPPGIFEVPDINLIFKFLLPHVVKVNITSDDIRHRSNLSNNKTTRFTMKSSFYTVSVLTQSRSRVLGDIEGFIQLIPGS